MLVLTRKEDESIIINGNIEITMLKISGKKVRVGITAPPEISVHRREIHEMVESQINQSQDEPEKGLS